MENEQNYNIKEPTKKSRKKKIVLSIIGLIFVLVIVISAFGYYNYKKNSNETTDLTLEEVRGLMGEENISETTGQDPNIKNPLTDTNPRRSFLNSSGDEVAYIDHFGNIEGVGNVTAGKYGFFQYLGSSISRITKGWFVNLDVSQNITSTNLSVSDDVYVGGSASSALYVSRNAWTDHDNYPAGCGAGDAVRVIGDTLTCIDVYDATDDPLSSIAEWQGLCNDCVEASDIGDILDASHITDIYVFTGGDTMGGDLNLGDNDLENIGTVYHDDTTRYLSRVTSTGTEGGTLYNIGTLWNTTTNYLHLRGYSGINLDVQTTNVLTSTTSAMTITPPLTVSGALAAPTLDTGQGANDLYDMDQNVLIGSSPAFVTTKLSALTDNYVPYHVSDASGLANSDIYWDTDITEGVGIGTTTPGNSSLGTVISSTDGPTIHLKGTSSSSLNFEAGGATQGVIQFIDTSPVVDYSSASIYVATGDYKLIGQNGTSNFFYGTQHRTIYKADLSGAIKFFEQNANNLKFEIYNTTPMYDGIFGISSTISGGGEIFMVDNAGNVGIGDASPSYKLDVAGTGRFTGALTASSFTGAGTGLTGTAASLTCGAGDSATGFFSAGTLEDDRLSFTLQDAVTDGGCTNCITDAMVSNTLTASYATNAGTLDTIDSLSFLRSDTSDYLTAGNIYLGGATTYSIQSDGDADLRYVGIGVNPSATYPLYVVGNAYLTATTYLGVTGTYFNTAGTLVCASCVGDSDVSNTLTASIAPDQGSAGVDELSNVFYHTSSCGTASATTLGTICVIY